MEKQKNHLCNDENAEGKQNDVSTTVKKQIKGFKKGKAKSVRLCDPELKNIKFEGY